MKTCQILVKCPLLEIDKPCQFENGKCPLQQKVIELADELERIEQSTKEKKTGPLNCANPKVTTCGGTTSAAVKLNDLNLQTPRPTESGEDELRNGN